VVANSDVRSKKRKRSFRLRDFRIPLSKWGHKEAPKKQNNSLCASCAFLWLSAGGALARGGCVQAEAGAHALLPGALFTLAFFNLRPDAS